MFKKKPKKQKQKQESTPRHRPGGSPDVYTGLLFVAFLVLATGVTLLALRNIEHSGLGPADGSPIQLIN